MFETASPALDSAKFGLTLKKSFPNGLSVPNLDLPKQ
jgi:hypothetical protein